MSVTTTSLRQGKFETRFWHTIFEEEVGRVKGHFGPINTFVVPSFHIRVFLRGFLFEGLLSIHWERAMLLEERMALFEYTTLMIPITRQNPLETWKL